MSKLNAPIYLVRVMNQLRDARTKELVGEPIPTPYFFSTYKAHGGPHYYPLSILPNDLREYLETHTICQIPESELPKLIVLLADQEITLQQLNKDKAIPMERTND